MWRVAGKVVLSLALGAIPQVLYYSTTFVSYDIPERATQQLIVEVEGLVSRFQIDRGRYPTDAEGLQILKDTDSFDETIVREIPKDRWGNEIQYREKVPDQIFGIYSMGEDGKSLTNGNDKDDISNWRMSEALSYYESKRMRLVLISEFLVWLVVSSIAFVLLSSKKAGDETRTSGRIDGRG